MRGHDRKIMLCGLVVGGVGCSFTGYGIPANDASPPAVIDTATPRELRITAGVTRGADQVIAVSMLSASTLTGCGEFPSPATAAIRDFVSHPTLRLFYEVESGFGAIAPDCSGIQIARTESLGVTRAVQRIAFDASREIGFFTIDGAGSIGVYRFTTAQDGMPTVAGSANATTGSSVIALDAAGAELFIGGTNLISSHALAGATLDLPAAPTSVVGCTTPADLLVSGGFVLEFCGDGGDIRRYTRGPFAFEKTVGAFGPVTRVIGLPGDRAAAVRNAPPELTLLDLHQGSPTWSPGQPLASAPLALAASADGSFLVTARQVDPTTSEIEAWRVDGQQLTSLAHRSIDGTVTALAITD